MTVFLDTNILLYAVLRPADADEPKRERARALLERDDRVLSLQVLQEFVNQATHPRRAQRLSIEHALEYVEAFRQFPVQETTLALLDEGLRLFRHGGFSFWDSMIVAAARAQGCEMLYSEDMQDGRIVDGMRIVDPFR